MKKVFALMGSPRKNKNTDKLLNFLLEGIRTLDYDIEKIYIKDLDIHSCTGCDHCGKYGNCVFKDDMSIVYDGFDNSEIVIFSAPLYFNSINGMSKNIVDRCQKYWSIKYSLGKNYKRNERRKGIFLSVGGAPYTHNHFDGTVGVMDLFFKAINVDYIGNYFISNTDETPIEERIDVINEIKEIGENIDKVGNFYIHR
ncbi:flavodoxin family protein [Paratissierella segnis]|jgi:multimeric flavodoxin WrbA|uniref:Flavodoxin family protein n=1 Tax=Paratissierella segnis TaxID=2763679 RepID=A0A926EVY2_9FIRM|nr:flavodoxin family protein [Paratissierella segnis]MBC8588512.1 flavodoxin family protein [Paratissierella segnis]